MNSSEFDNIPSVPKVVQSPGDRIGEKAAGVQEIRRTTIYQKLRCYSTSPSLIDDVEGVGLFS